HCRFRQRLEPRNRPGPEIINDKSERRILFDLRRAGLVNVPILIALNRDGRNRLQQVKSFPRPERAVKDVAKIDELLDAPSPRVRQNRFESMNIAMNV